MRTPPTALRYCPRCGAEVEAAGGYCLLGHSVALTAATDMSELRAEVERVFEEARSEVVARVSAAVEPAPPLPPPVRPPTTYEPDAPPPPPPPGGEKRSIWAALEADAPPADDPIAAFAPAPRMDWGPQRDVRRRRLFRRAADASD